MDALASRTVSVARTAKLLKYFEPVANLPGFARALARTLAELRLAQVSPADVSTTGLPGRDLGELLALYEAELADRRLADLARVLELATEAASIATHRWLGLPLLLLDSPLESRAHADLFECVAARAPAVLAAVTSGETTQRAMHAQSRLLESILRVDAEDLDDSAQASQGRASSLGRLRSQLFAVSPVAGEQKDDEFDLFSAPGEGLEAVEIARRVLQFARKNVAFDSIAILLRNPERYQPMIEDALRRAGIPAYFSRGVARPDVSGRAFLALLACAAEKCSASRFAEYLSLGQVPVSGQATSPDAATQPAADSDPAATEDDWVGPNDEMFGIADSQASPVKQEPEESNAPPAPWGWEKLLVDAAVIGGSDRWERRLIGLEHEFELRLSVLEREDEAQRAQLARKIEQLRHLRRFALPLIGTLAALPQSALWKDWLDRLAELARAGLRSPDAVLAVLAEFEPMGDVGPVGLEEVFEVLSDRLRFLRRDPPQRRYGRVFVGSIDESRGREFAVVFLPGLAESLFPKRALEDPLLLDEFRREASPHLLLRDDRTAEERLRLRLAVSAAGERLIASYPRMDVAEGRPRVPSFYAMELVRAIEGRLPELKQFEIRTRDAAPARLNWPSPPDSADAIDNAEYDLATLARALTTSSGGHYLVESNAHLARSLRTRWSRWESQKWTKADGLLTADAAALEILAKHRLTERAWSPSSLQQFAACPYKFALYGIHELRPREEFGSIEQLDPLTRGALFHEVQFALLSELKAQGLLPVNELRLAAALEWSDRVLERVAAEYEENLAPAIPGVWRSEIEDIRTDLRGWLQHVAQNDDDWEPVHFEFGFGLRAGNRRDPSSTAAEAALSEGVRLRGSIDLLERHLVKGALRVTDHKTGKPPERIPLYVGAGHLLQPLLYGRAAEELLGTPVESGRLFYSTQRGGYQQVSIPVTDKSKQFLAKLLSNIDGFVAGGFLPAAPEKDACDICDFRIVCGPYEETRLKRKDQRDERLDGLTEIRGMP